MPYAENIYYAVSSLSQVKRAPVVLLHGAGSSHLVWPPSLRRMTGRDIYALDLPGHGKSEGVCCESIDAFAESISAWQRSLGLGPSIWIGHSMGAAIALEFARKHPDHVLGMALLCVAARFAIPAAWMPTSHSRNISAKEAERWSERMLRLGAPILLRHRIAESLLAVPATVFAKDLKMCQEWNFEPHAKEVSCPVLLVAGESDALVPRLSVRALAESLPRGEFFEAVNAGHLPMLENEPVVREAVQSFIERCDSASGRSSTLDNELR